MDVRAALADVAGLGDFFAVGTDPAEKADPGWLPLTQLYRDPGPLRDRIAEVRDVLGSDDRVAASIAFQGIAARVLSGPFAAAVLHAVVPRLTADALHFRVPVTGALPLWCDDPLGTPVAGPAGTVDALADLLFAGHLVPLIAAVRAQVRNGLSERLLWGSVASAIAAGKRLLTMERPAAAGRVADVAQRLLATGPLVGTGELREPVAPDRVWSFRRRSCCLYYRVPGGGLCEDCVLASRPR